MKIALIGYGKMGQAIEQIALRRGHEIVLKVDHHNLEQLADGSLATADVAIEFTRPDAALGNITACFKAKVPVVCGTTGWNEQLLEAHRLCKELNGALLQSSNFSIGVNIFFEVNKKLAALMQQQPAYDVTIEEVHHTQKKDAPSGTAITIAEQILHEMDRKKSWALNSSKPDEISITALREEGVPGTHTVTYNSSIDRIDLVHTAHSREGFALGAVLAAEFVKGKTGVFSMSDVLGI